MLMPHGNQQASEASSIHSNYNGTLGGRDPSPSLSTERLHDATLGEQNGSRQARSRWKRYLSNAEWLVYDQWFLVALGVLILIASQVQVPESQQQTKETIVTYLAVAVIFFITGCTLPTTVLLQNYRRWRLHLFSQVQSFLLTSAIAFGIVSACAANPDFLDSGLMVGLIFTGCVPTTISSNIIMTGQANGNQALTTVESTLGNFLGPFISPLLLLMYTSVEAYYTKFLPGLGSGGFGELYRRVFKQLGLSLFLPLVSHAYLSHMYVLCTDAPQAIGQAVQNIFPNLTNKVFKDWKLSKLGSISLLVIIWQTFDQAFATGAFESVQGDNMIFVVFISIALYALWTAICVSLSLFWLGKADTIAIAYIVPAKTPAMGVPLSNVMFPGLSPVAASKLQIPMVIFQGLQIGAGSLLTLVFRKWIGENNEKVNAGSSRAESEATRSED